MAGTPWDLRTPTILGDPVQPGSAVAGGYDACYLVDRSDPGPVLMATLTAPAHGRRLDILSTEPALVLYTGNYLDGSLRGKQHAVYGKHSGVCLETAHLPDSVNRPEFPFDHSAAGRDLPADVYLSLLCAELGFPPSVGG